MYLYVSVPDILTSPNISAPCPCGALMIHCTVNTGALRLSSCFSFCTGSGSWPTMVDITVRDTLTNSSTSHHLLSLQLNLKTGTTDVGKSCFKYVYVFSFSFFFDNHKMRPNSHRVTQHHQYKIQKLLPDLTSLVILIKQQFLSWSSVAMEQVRSLPRTQHSLTTGRLTLWL